MNKQELIEKFKARRTIIGNFQGYGIYWEDIKEIFERLDEPEKVTIPKFVVDWIKVAKPVYSLSGAMVYGSPGVKKWLENEDNQRIFAQAWFDGYEKEKRYRVSMPKARNHKNHAQILCEKDAKTFWCGEWYPFKTKFTRKELEEANFGWVFSCEGIEIEEVE